MSMEKKVFRAFTVDNFEKEETFLRDMSSKGWHFKRYQGMRYFFEESTPTDFQYRIDYHNSSEGDIEEYLQFFEDSGWHAIFSYPIFDGYWCYFRKRIKGNKNLEIYTDHSSKIDLFKKIRLKWGIFGLIFTFLILPFVLFATSSTYFFTNLIVYAVCGSVVFLYIKLVLNLTKKIHHLNK